MNKFGCFFLFSFFALDFLHRRNFPIEKKTTLHPTSDTLQFSKVSISPVNFQVLKNQVPLSKDSYRVDFAKGMVYLNAKENPEITIVYHFISRFFNNTLHGYGRKFDCPVPNSKQPTVFLEKKEHSSS